jgi:hypothetical protein
LKLRKSEWIAWVFIRGKVCEFFVINFGCVVLSKVGLVWVYKRSWGLEIVKKFENSKIEASSFGVDGSFEIYSFLMKK